MSWGINEMTNKSKYRCKNKNMKDANNDSDTCKKKKFCPSFVKVHFMYEVLYKERNRNEVNPKAIV